MSVHRVVPDLTTDRPTETKEFHTALLGLDVAVDRAGWSIRLGRPSR